MNQSNFVRFINKVSIDHNSGCWNWTASRNRKDGYGVFCVGQERYVAHRVLYEYVNSIIPSNLVLDHLCRNKICVNPNHLEVVTHRVNILRGTGASARNAIKKKCPSGHLYDDQNTLIKKRRNGLLYRRCRLCNKKQLAAAFQKRKLREKLDSTQR